MLLFFILFQVKFWRIFDVLLAYCNGDVDFGTVTCIIYIYFVKFPVL